MALTVESCVIESRVWLSRNIKAYPFPIAMNKEMNHQMIDELEQVFQSEKIRNMYHLSWRSSHEIGYAEQQVLQLKYGINHKRFEDRIYQMVEDRVAKLMIFVGADDHLRIQMHGEGLRLIDLWESIDDFDDQIDNAVEYAFDTELGYLTSHVTDVGTGIHASVLLHLPALTATGYIERVNQAASQLGLTVSGLSELSAIGSGDLYRIENHVTLGRSEREIVDTISEVVRQIAIKENDALETLMVSRRLEMEDKINRSIGILSKARLLDRKEYLEHYSNVRMGIRVGILKDTQVLKLDELLFQTDSGVLQMTCGKLMNALELKAQRASICRVFFEQEA